MSRKTDLEQLIHTSADLMVAYEKKKQSSDDPKEILRCDDEIERQRTLMAGYCREYVKLCQAIGELISPEIALPCTSVDVVIPAPPPTFPSIQPQAREDPPMFKLTLQFSQFGSQVQVRIDGGAIAGVASANIMLPDTPQLDTFAPSAVLRATGQALYQALLGGSVGEVFRSVRNAARREGQPVTLQLRFDREAVQLAQYPWELLHDGDQFLLLSGPGIDIVRYVTFPQAVTAVRVQPPLTVVLVASSPSDLPTLDVTSLLGTLQELVNVQVNLIDPATYRQLVTRLGPAQPAAHVFHFEGHGSFTAEQGGIYFEDNRGKSAFVTAEGLATALSKSNIALAVVNACHSADVEGISLFNSIAPALVLAGVPAVIGMQGQITDHAATDFAGVLYEDLSSCVSVTAALAHARTFLFQGNEWYKPVLYLRSTDDAGQILVGCNNGNRHEPPAPHLDRERLSRVDRVKLLEAMDKAFGPTEIDLLAWKLLGGETSHLEGANKPAKISSLIDWHIRHEEYAKLVAKVIEERPHLAKVLLE